MVFEAGKLPLPFSSELGATVDIADGLWPVILLFSQHSKCLYLDTNRRACHQSFPLDVISSLRQEAGNCGCIADKRLQGWMDELMVEAFWKSVCGHFPWMTRSWLCALGRIKTW